MRAPKLLIVSALALVACGEHSEPARDEAAEGRPALLSKAAVMSSPASAPAAFGVVGGVSAQVPPEVAAASNAVAQSATGADPLQNVNASTTGAPTMVIRTGQAFIEVERVDPAILKWRNQTIVKLAQAIYEECAFDRLPVLADALEDADCTNNEILAHCRQPCEHVRGCWLIDSILGKK